MLQIPVPQVHAWSALVDNRVGSEYIIMEEAPGTKLGDVWDALPLEERVAITEDLVSIEKKFLSISFTRFELATNFGPISSTTNPSYSYGNLYYSSDHVRGAATAEVVGHVDQEIRSEIMQRFTVGPVVNRGFWSKERSIMKDIDRGPCTLSHLF